MNWQNWLRLHIITENVWLDFCVEQIKFVKVFLTLLWILVSIFLGSKEFLSGYVVFTNSTGCVFFLLRGLPLQWFAHWDILGSWEKIQKVLKITAYFTHSINLWYFSLPLVLHG